MLTAAARADDPRLEVTVRGSTAGAYVSRTSTDTAPREPIDAASLLAELPSVHIRRLGADGAFAAISVRGSASSQVGVVLAGIPLTSAADPSLDVGSLPLWPGASFRVYRGFAPASLGTTGYLGGVLAVDPPSPAIGERTEWWTAAGSFGSLKLRLGDLRRIGSVELGTGFFASRSDGDFSFVQQDPATLRVTQGTRLNAGQAAIGGIERLALVRPWGSVAALVFADSRSSGVPGRVEDPTRFVHLRTSRLVAGLEANLRVGETSSIRLLDWVRREASALEDPAGELAATTTSSTRSEILAAGLMSGFRLRPREGLSVNALLDGRTERFTPSGGARLQASSPATRLAGGGGAEIEWRATERLTLSGSARLDARRDDATGILTVGSPGSVSGDFAPTGHAGASYRFADAAVVSAHAGALSRPPGFQELYGDGATLVANPALRAERGYSADLGIHGDWGDGHQVLSYEAVGFVTMAQDLIVLLPLGVATFQASNIASALLGGAELSGALASRHARLQASYTLLFTQNRSKIADERGQPLPGRPQHDLALDASYSIGPVGLRYGLDAVAGTNLYASGGDPLPPRVLHGAGASLEVPGVPGLRAAIDLQNLFDLRTMSLMTPAQSLHFGAPISILKPVSDFLGFPLPGRTIWLTLRYRIEPSPR